jgi:hypothetical protein
MAGDRHDAVTYRMTKVPVASPLAYLLPAGRLDHLDDLSNLDGGGT